MMCKRQTSNIVHLSSQGQILLGLGLPLPSSSFCQYTSSMQDTTRQKKGEFASCQVYAKMRVEY